MPVPERPGVARPTRTGLAPSTKDLVLAVCFTGTLDRVFSAYAAGAKKSMSSLLTRSDSS